MSDDSARGAHVGAALAAREAVGELQQMLAAVHDKIEEVLGMVANATGGGACPSESGRNAFEFTAALIEEQEIMYQHTAGIVGELERYAGGF